MKRIFINCLTLLLILCLYAGIFFASNVFFSRFIPSMPLLPDFVALMVIVFFSRVIHTKIDFFLKRPSEQQKINYPQFLKAFSTVLMTIVDLKKLSEVVINTLHSFYDLVGSSIMLYDQDKKCYHVMHSCGEASATLVLAEDNPLCEFFCSHNIILIREKLDQSEESMRLREVLTTLGSDMCIPLIFKHNFLGLINLGRRKSGEPFTSEDADAFFNLESQISVAFNNAILFKAQKEAHVVLAQKNQMDAIIALSSGINHEINNPLSIISMRCQNYLRKVSTGKFLTANEMIQKAQEVIESSLRNAKRAHLITKRLANFAKPIQEEMNIQPVKIKECLQECIDLIGKKQFHGDNILIKNEIPDTLPDVYADKVHFQQILYNMVMNAYHAIESDGSILFRAYEKGSKKVVLEITDTGCGICEENLHKIWEPFFTTKPTNPLPGKKTTGTGLGLSLVKRYIESSGGAVEVKSAVGRGTTFYLHLVKVQES